MKHTKGTKPGEAPKHIEATPEFIAQRRAEEEARKAYEDSIRYVGLRKSAYYETLGTTVDQLDYIYHNGIDAWKEEIRKIKEQYPKPGDKDV